MGHNEKHCISDQKDSSCAISLNELQAKKKNTWTVCPGFASITALIAPRRNKKIKDQLSDVHFKQKKQ